MQKVCEGFNDIFAEFTELPLEREIKHHIELLDNSKSPPYPR